VLGAYFFGLIPLVFLSCFYWQFSLVIIPLILIYFYAKQYFNKWIDGYTGDCLGALEQAAELLTLLSFLAIWKFI
jgi:adenosylcobinamide-GDP ribazoletransferase